MKKSLIVLFSLFMLCSCNSKNTNNSISNTTMTYHKDVIDLNNCNDYLELYVPIYNGETLTCKGTLSYALYTCSLKVEFGYTGSRETETLKLSKGGYASKYYVGGVTLLDVSGFVEYWF